MCCVFDRLWQATSDVVFHKVMQRHYSGEVSKFIIVWCKIFPGFYVSKIIKIGSFSTELFKILKGERFWDTVWILRKRDWKGTAFGRFVLLYIYSVCNKILASVVLLLNISLHCLSFCVCYKSCVVFVCSYSLANKRIHDFFSPRFRGLKHEVGMARGQVLHRQKQISRVGD